MPKTLSDTTLSSPTPNSDIGHGLDMLMGITCFVILIRPVVCTKNMAFIVNMTVKIGQRGRVYLLTDLCEKLQFRCNFSSSVVVLRN